MKRTDERGFTLVEILIATTILIAIAVATLTLMRGLTAALDRRGTAQSGALLLETTITQMRTEADTAFAVFVPNRDIFGNANDASARAGAGHEVDFYSKTDTGEQTSWAYRYDANAKTLQRYDYNMTTGAIGVFDRVRGDIVSGSYPPITHVNAFSAKTLQANELTDASKSPFAGVLASLTSTGGPITANPVGFVPNSGVARSDLYGGNATVLLAIATDRGERSFHLVSGAPASGFTIHEALAIRAFVYRKLTHHRSFGGIVSTSRAHVFEQLQYNLQPSRATSKWQVWCDYEIYGQDRKLHYDSTGARYEPRDFKMTTSFSFFSVTHDGVRNHDDRGGCDKKYPTVNDTPAPLPSAPPEDIGTPPPCWYAATPCWPYSSPSNWAAPSPWPKATPPPDFCAGHQQSTICGGTGAGPTPTPNSGDGPSDTFSPPSAPEPNASAASTPISGSSPIPIPVESRGPISPGDGRITQ